jgi:hypothetical protein
MNKLLKDAIADAKAVRETALANAKVALEEAFAPKLQSMLSHKIKEEMEEEGEEEVEDENKMETARMQNLAGITSEAEDEEAIEDESSEEEISFDDEMGDEEEPSNDDMESDEDVSSDDDEEVSDEDLEEILRELEGEEEGEEMEDENVDPNAANYDADQETKMDESEDPEDKSEMDEEIDLDEIINALKEEDEAEEKEDEAKMESIAAELNEAYSVIKFLRSKLNEVNLLNAKLLFVNKLFRKGELTETQKVKIIETFDRAKNVREAKLIYATLAESVNNKDSKKPTKRKMNEGFASAPQKKTEIISESTDVYKRFKTLVNYNR